MAKENLNLIFGSVGAEMLVSNVTQHQTETSLWLICTTLSIGLCMRLVDVTISLIQKVHGTYEDEPDKIGPELPTVVCLSTVFVTLSIFSYFDFYPLPEQEIITACHFLLIYSVLGYLSIILLAFITTPIVGFLRFTDAKDETIDSASDWTFFFWGFAMIILWVELCLRVGGCIVYRYSSDPMNAWKFDLSFWGAVVSLIFFIIPLVLFGLMIEDTSNVDTELIEEDSKEKLEITL